MKGQVLKLLREHNTTFLSGEKMSQVIGCSRTAIWKHIDALRKEGYDIVASQNKGYQLRETYPMLSEHEILSYLPNDSLFTNVIFYRSINSTQMAAQKQVSDGMTHGTLVVADEQTNGKGRLGRTWHSEKDSGVWMSLIVKPDIAFEQAPQLTLLTAVSVTRAIEKLSKVNVTIKWPNDLLINGKKVCGILTEMQADTDRLLSVIIGIGLNVNHKQFSDPLTDIATSLFIETGKTYDRSQLIGGILDEFTKLYQLYLDDGFAIIKPLWEAHASSTGKKISARTATTVIEGIALGIDNEGVLLLEDEAGKVHKIYSADIDLH
ncbi:biotin--[acetyl-CoA-carboxylase] ligase [Salipaludibacillus agaradhaerens]|uniref:Bifunctional ligase/repressor BirA n=1 Tax=Salipaludibacillus agaradhaerens TaxID=76935 RepID=A0A9Q4B186_SALAG|nr:biotin--[acetyl-CoA-carboxylase] ligase [Salipaludibacillus agaradhaerens]MCR6096487.1 biotin--[acetyl-CoA-carboxylase] ligase [Salipaludibacillus agaradhaerens]MCR6113954.1 biotin--[acetyl-CoA-carboxylase] ligase [Salipaludibacillus agaradhaerens]